MGDFCLHLEVNSHLHLSRTYNVGHFATQIPLAFLAELNFRSSLLNCVSHLYRARDSCGSGNTYPCFSSPNDISLAWATSDQSFFACIKILLGGITSKVKFGKHPLLSFGRLRESLPSFLRLERSSFSFSFLGLLEKM